MRCLLLQNTENVKGNIGFSINIIQSKTIIISAHHCFFHQQNFHYIFTLTKNVTVQNKFHPSTGTEQNRNFIWICTYSIVHHICNI